MTISQVSITRPRIAPLGLLFLALTSVGWGLNWPVMKMLLSEWPPLTARGATGLVGAALLAGLALLRGESLAVPRAQWGRLVLLAALNVFGWMALMGLALLWLPAGEAAVIAYTMPIWAAGLAWGILGERMSLQRIAAMLMAFAGIALLMAGNGAQASTDKLPGLLLALVGAFGFALGTVLAKKLPLSLPLLTTSAWQIAIGCAPVLLLGLAFETPRLAALTPLGWGLMAYVALVAFCIAYVCWFAALKLLPASVAAIGTMAVPVIGVVGAALMLREPLGLVQIAALLLTLAGVALATRG
jgi:drug/metabolite transporter (DMT)-like permease